jgi:curved DNA-binding protein CbpA
VSLTTGGSHYDTLGLPPNATAAEIREAYVRLLEAHWRRVGQAALPGPKAAAELAALTTAYEVLVDPRRRAEHDWRLGIDDLQPLDWGGAHPDPSALDRIDLPRRRRLSPLGWLRAFPHRRRP